MDPIYSNEELQSILWDIMEECINGRTQGHKCPMCGEGDLEIEVLEDVKVSMSCPACRKQIDAKIA